MKKTLFLLNVDGYAPEITELTYPLIERYADRMGADIHVIEERRFPEWPPVYEKLQIGELAAAIRSEWNVYMDSDVLVHPNAIDVTEHLAKDTVLHNGADFAGIRWTYDEYFRRDGRNVGSCNWLAVASDWCLDLWTPLDIPLEEAVSRIHPTQRELACGIDAEHLIDDYTLSRNIARFGLKFTTLFDVSMQKGMQGLPFFWHAYDIPLERKVKEMKEVLATPLWTGEEEEAPTEPSSNMDD